MPGRLDGDGRGASLQIQARQVIALFDQAPDMQPRLVAEVRREEGEAGAWPERHLLCSIIARLDRIARNAAVRDVWRQHVVATKVFRARHAGVAGQGAPAPLAGFSPAGSTEAALGTSVRPVIVDCRVLRRRGRFPDTSQATTCRSLLADNSVLPVNDSTMMSFFCPPSLSGAINPRSGSHIAILPSTSPL